MSRTSDKDCNKKCRVKKFFAQISSSEFIDLPRNLPDIEQIVTSVIDCEIVSLKTINTMKGLSYEGQFLSGKKVVIEIKLRQKILYVANQETQSVHVVENVYYQSAYIVIPCIIEGTDPGQLLKHKILKCKVEVENVFITQINKRKLFKNVTLFISAQFTRTFEICFSVHHNCTSGKMCIMHNDGSQVSDIIPNRKDKIYKPRWSPNGREIGYISRHKGHDSLDIFNLRLGTSKILPVSSEFRSILDFCWSPDGTNIIFTGHTCGSNCDIYNVSLMDGQCRQLTFGNGFCTCHNAKFSPCGSSIAYIRRFSGIDDIWVMDNTGMNNSKLTSSGTAKDYDWSPDSSKIACICTVSGAADQVHIIDMDCHRDEQICQNNSIHMKRKIHFSPDGRHLAFIGMKNDTDDVYIYDFSTKDLCNATHNENDVRLGDLVWGIDSDKLYYVAKEHCFSNIYSLCLEDNRKNQITGTMATRIDIDYRPVIC